MAEELRKRREDVAEYLRQMVDFTKEGKKKEAQKAYREACYRLDEKSYGHIEKVEDLVGNPNYAIKVAKAALKALNSYSRHINREIKRLEKEEKKFEKLRKKLEKKSEQY